jgi:hypothetical protein
MVKPPQRLRLNIIFPTAFTVRQGIIIVMGINVHTFIDFVPQNFAQQFVHNSSPHVQWNSKDFLAFLGLGISKLGGMSGSFIILESKFFMITSLRLGLIKFEKLRKHHQQVTNKVTCSFDPLSL